MTAAEALRLRLADERDTAALRVLMNLAIRRLQSAFLTPEQVTASYSIMGLDTQLIADRTYFVVEAGADLAGCGGWSRRATLFGGDHSADRDAALLDPLTTPARVRAMYTHPDFARRGVGRMILRRVRGDCRRRRASAPASWPRRSPASRSTWPVATGRSSASVRRRRRELTCRSCGWANPCALPCKRARERGFAVPMPTP